MIKYRTCYRSSPNALFSFDVPWSHKERKHLEYCIPRVHLSVRYSSFSTCSVFTGYHLSLWGKKVFEEKERKKRRKKKGFLRILDLKSNRLNVNNRDNESTGISLKKIWRNVRESNIFFPFEIRKKTKGERIKNEKSYDK